MSDEQSGQETKLDMPLGPESEMEQKSDRSLNVEERRKAFRQHQCECKPPFWIESESDDLDSGEDCLPASSSLDAAWDSTCIFLQGFADVATDSQSDGITMVRTIAEKLFMTLFFITVCLLIVLLFVASAVWKWIRGHGAKAAERRRLSRSRQLSKQISFSKISLERYDSVFMSVDHGNSLYDEDAIVAPS